MNLLQQFSVGLSGYAQAHQFIKQHRLYGYFVVPMVLNLGLFLLVTSIGWSVAGDISEWFYTTVGLGSADWGRFDFVKSVIRFTVALVLRIMLLLAYMATFRYIILILLAPVLALLSERVEEILTGRSFPFSLPRLLSDALRGIRIAIVNGVKELVVSIALLILSFVPGVGIVTPFAAFTMESYFYGFSMIDYYGERQRWTAAETSRFIWQIKGIAIANGAVFNAMLLACSLLASLFPLAIGFLLKAIFILPILGLSIAPIYGVIAATLSVMELPEATLKPLPHDQV